MECVVLLPPEDLPPEPSDLEGLPDSEPEDFEPESCPLDEVPSSGEPLPLDPPSSLSLSRTFGVTTSRWESEAWLLLEEDESPLGLPLGERFATGFSVAEAMVDDAVAVTIADRGTSVDEMLVTTVGICELRGDSTATATANAADPRSRTVVSSIISRIVTGFIVRLPYPTRRQDQSCSA